MQSDNSDSPADGAKGEGEDEALEVESFAGSVEGSDSTEVEVEVAVAGVASAPENGTDHATEVERTNKKSSSLLKHINRTDAFIEQPEVSMLEPCSYTRRRTSGNPYQLANGYSP